MVLVLHSLLGVATALLASSSTSALFFFPPQPPVNASSPGGKACLALNQTLGPAKVFFKTTPNASEYRTTRTKWWNQQNDQTYPACVILPQIAQDVAAVVKQARKSKSKLAIKAGGHNPSATWSTTEGGVLIDMRSRNQISLDTASQTVTFGPGLRWGAIYQYLEPKGYAVVGGRIDNVGTGLSLSGGLSYLSAQYGLSCDNFVSLEVVLPSGKIVTATGDNEYADLFKGLKGGTNTLGIVTQYTVKAHPTTKWWGGVQVVNKKYTDKVLNATLNFILSNPDPKAAVIVTRNKAISGIIDAWFVFQAYDGPDPGHVFDEFSALPTSLDNRGVTTLSKLTSPAPTDYSGFANEFHNGVYKPTFDQLKNAVDSFEKFSLKNGLATSLLTLDFQPVPQSLIDASRAAGGNSYDSPDGPYFWLNAGVGANPDRLGLTWNRLRSDFVKNILPTPEPSLPLFLNDASDTQRVFQTWPGFPTLKKTKAKYDPDGFFTKYVDGPKYT